MLGHDLNVFVPVTSVQLVLDAEVRKMDLVIEVRQVVGPAAREAGDFLLKAPIVNATFAYLARRAQRDRPDTIGRPTRR